MTKDLISRIIAAISKHFIKKRGRVKKSFRVSVCLSLKDSPFGSVVFTEKARRNNLHLLTHPELNDNNFINHHVRVALTNPDKVFWSMINKNTIVIYKVVGKIDDPLNPGYKYSYTLVVLGIRNQFGVQLRPRQVRTAFWIDRIKEKAELKPNHYGKYL